MNRFLHLKKDKSMLYNLPCGEADTAPAVSFKDNNEDNNEAVPTAAQFDCTINSLREIFFLKLIILM